MILKDIIRLKEDNSEDFDIDSIVRKIKSECQPFLQATNTPMYRGIRNKPVDELLRLTVRMNRRPLDTSESVSQILDDLLEPIAGFKPRSEAIFCIGVPKPGMYGVPYTIFPIGDFKFIYSDVITDFYNDILLGHATGELGALVRKSIEEVLFPKYDVTSIDDVPYVLDKYKGFSISISDIEQLQGGLGEDAEDAIEIVEHFITNNPHLYKTTDLNAAIQSHREIMIHCKEYFAIPVNWLKENGYNSEQLFKLLKM